MSHPAPHSQPVSAGLTHPTHYADPQGRWYEVLQRGSAHWHQLSELTDSGPGPAHWQQVTGLWSPLSPSDVALWLSESGPGNNHPGSHSS